LARSGEIFSRRIDLEPAETLFRLEHPRDFQTCHPQVKTIQAKGRLTMKTTATKSINPVRHSLRRSLRRHGFVLIPLSFTMLALALSPQAWADRQEGCDPGERNPFLGNDALVSNFTGQQNTATGDGPLASNTTGSYNTATGYQALQVNASGNNNTATGVNALVNNTTGSSNIALGNSALSANTGGSSNIAIGNGAGSLLTTNSNNIEMGHEVTSTDANTIRR
jgi:hypothetical protein